MHNIDADARKIRRTSSGAVVLREENGQWLALVLRAWSHWDFPKGNVEAGETLMQAAVREVREETGVSDLAFPWGEAFARTCVYSKDKVAYYSLALSKTTEVRMDPNPVTGLREHDEYRWVPWEELPALLSPRLHCILEWAGLLAKLPPPDFSRRAVLGAKNEGALIGATVSSDSGEKRAGAKESQAPAKPLKGLKRLRNSRRGRLGPR